MPKKTKKPNVKQDPKWRRFEKIVTAIHVLTSQGADVLFDDHIRGKKTGEEWQVDVSIRYKSGLYNHLAIIECKDKGRAIEVKEVQAFVTKMDDIGANKGVMVSANGFQKGAVTTAATYGIELYTLTEEPTTWLGKIIRHVTKIDVPTSFYVRTDEFEKRDDTVECEPGELMFYKDDGASISLADIVNETVEEMRDKGIAPPFKTDIVFDPPRTVLLPNAKSTCTAYMIFLELGYMIPIVEQVEHESKGTVDYVYKSALDDEKHVFPSHELPFGADNKYEVGKFYFNESRNIIKCISIEGDEATIVGFNPFGEKMMGCLLIYTNIETAQHYRPLNNPDMESWYENIYQESGIGK